MSACPCCSQVLLRCVRKDGVYWFCSHCWQEMPDLDSVITAQKRRQQLKYSSFHLNEVQKSWFETGSRSELVVCQAKIDG